MFVLRNLQVTPMSDNSTQLDTVIINSDVRLRSTYHLLGEEDNVDRFVFWLSSIAAGAERW